MGIIFRLYHKNVKDISVGLADVLNAISNLSIRIQGEGAGDEELGKILEEERLKLIQSRSRLIDAANAYEKRFRGESK